MFGDRGEQYDPSEPEEFYRRMVQDWYYAVSGLPVPGLQGPLGNGAWLPLPPPRLVPFELYDDVAPGDVDKYAWPMKADLSDKDTSGDKIKVSDGLLGDVRAYGCNHSGFSQGAHGWYILGGNGKNQIVVVQRLSKILKAQTTALVHSGDSTFTIDQVAPLDDGQSPVPSTSTTLSVSNQHAWAAPSGTECQIVADGSGGWRFDSGPRPGIRYKGNTTAGVNSSDGSFTVNTVSPVDGGTNLLSALSTVTVTNWAGWQADASGRTCEFTIDTSSAINARFAQGGCWAAP